MAECFCGCGRRVPRGLKSVNKRGKIIYGDVLPVATLMTSGMVSPNAEMFIHDGKILIGVLADAVHEGVDPGPEVERESRGFMAYARQNFSTSQLGKAVRRSGYSTDDALAAIRAGDFDPYAGAADPR